MPLDPPVMTATLPSSFPMISPFVVSDSVRLSFAQMCCILWITDPDADPLYTDHRSVCQYTDHRSVCQGNLCEPTLEKITATYLKSRGTSSPSMAPMRPCEISPAGPASGWPHCFAISRREKPCSKRCCVRIWTH